MLGWLSEPHGYGLNDTPGLMIDHGFPSLPIRRSSSAPSPSTWKNPHCPSRPLSPPVKPCEASSAAKTPFSLARAALSGLLIDPKLTRTPADRLAAIASTCASCASFNFINLPAAAAAPNAPNVPVL